MGSNAVLDICVQPLQCSTLQGVLKEKALLRGVQEPVIAAATVCAPSHLTLCGAGQTLWLQQSVHSNSASRLHAIFFKMVAAMLSSLYRQYIAAAEPFKSELSKIKQPH